MEAKSTRPVLCPSAQPAMAGSMAFGVVTGTAEEPRVAWIEKPVPVTGDLLALTGPVPPTQVLRFSAPCQESGVLSLRWQRLSVGNAPGSTHACGRKYLAPLQNSTRLPLVHAGREGRLSAVPSNRYFQCESHG
jgi:hypothetical protein